MEISWFKGIGHNFSFKNFNLVMPTIYNLRMLADRNIIQVSFLHFVDARVSLVIFPLIIQCDSMVITEHFSILS